MSAVSTVMAVYHDVRADLRAGEQVAWAATTDQPDLPGSWAWAPTAGLWVYLRTQPATATPRPGVRLTPGLHPPGTPWARVHGVAAPGGVLVVVTDDAGDLVTAAGAREPDDGWLLQDPGSPRAYHPRPGQVYDVRAEAVVDAIAYACGMGHQADRLLPGGSARLGYVPGDVADRWASGWSMARDDLPGGLLADFGLLAWPVRASSH